MYSIKKIKQLILILLFLSTIAGCSSKDGNISNNSVKKDSTEAGQAIEIGGNQVKIGLALGTLAEERWINEKNCFENEASKYGALVFAQDANMDENLQNSQIENLISQKVNVLVIVAVNDKSAATGVAAAKKAGIPVMAYSRMIMNADLDAFIGFDAVSIGESLAKEAVARVPKGNYFIINGSPTDSNAKSQQVGYYNILKSHIEKGDIKVLFETWCDSWSPEKALAAVENGLTMNHDKIDAIIISNDGMAGGVIQALKQRKLEKKVFVTGTDGDLSALQRIAEGSQSITLLFPQKEFAEEAARAAISLANDLVPADATGKTFNGLKNIPTIFAQTVLVTKDNLYKVIIQSGLQKLEDIYKNVPLNERPK